MAARGLKDEPHGDLAKRKEAALREIHAMHRLIATQKARDGLLAFTQLMMPDPEDQENPEASLYRPAVVHRVIAEAIERVESGKILRLLLSVPPQHGKSTLASRAGPAWIIGRKPHRNIMLGTYNQDFANEFGDDVRAIMQQPEFAQVFPHANLRAGSKAKDHMVTSLKGKLSFLGRGGSGTGRPADFFFIDDPIKDAKEAESVTIRNDVWQWFTRVVYTRCHTLSAIVVIQTRWSEDDLIGRLIDPQNPHYNAEEAKKWTYINIPAMFDDPRDDDLAKALGKKRGDVLWPERFSREHLESAKALNPYAFSALYMGRPTPPEGAFFKVDMLHGYRSINELPHDMTMYGSCDLAVSPERDADKSCVGTWGIDHEGTLWLLPDLYWERKSADQSVEEIITRAKSARWLTLAGEKGVIERAVGPFLRKRMEERGYYFHVESFSRTRNKADHAVSIRGRMAMGKVKFPLFASWWPAARDQLLKFSGVAGNEDDFVDMLANMGEFVDRQIPGSVVVERKENVVKVGTFAWIKKMDKHKRERELRVANRRGF